MGERRCTPSRRSGMLYDLRYIEPGNPSLVALLDQRSPRAYIQVMLQTRDVEYRADALGPAARLIFGPHCIAQRRCF
jgi:hypothetical protein